MSTFSWNNLPSRQLIRERIREEFNEIGMPTEARERPVLYQFSLHVLCLLYCWLENPTLLDALNQPLPTTLHRPPTEERESSHLRAVAYFSWEPERHTFLIRRVFPRELDFLSYSHVPDGWGAVGKMRQQLKKKDTSHCVVENVNKDVSVLPYLREAARLQYESVFVLPVVNDPDELMGAFVFYLRSHCELPNHARSLKQKLRLISREMGAAVKKHLHVITEGIDDLPKLWRSFDSADYDGSSMLELKISLDVNRVGRGVRSEKILEEITSSVLGTLNTDDTFTILDQQQTKAPTKVFSDYR